MPSVTTFESLRTTRRLLLVFGLAFTSLASAQIPFTIGDYWEENYGRHTGTESKDAAKEKPAPTALSEQLIARCKALIDHDQLTINSGTADSASHRADLDTLDAIIGEVGWPSSYLIDGGGSGVAIVLAHQPWFSVADFEHYASIITPECLAQRESWQTMMLLLQQRIRHVARNDYDEVALAHGISDSLALVTPMILAINERMCANGHSRLTLKTQQLALADSTAAVLIRTQPPIRIDAATLEYLVSNGFDHPSPLTVERIAIETDPELPSGLLLFKMN